MAGDGPTRRAPIKAASRRRLASSSENWSVTAGPRVFFINRPPTQKEIKEKRFTRITPKLRDRKFRPHATLLGQIVLSWSELHDALARLFYAVIGAENAATALAVWHSNRNDRSQRAMLAAAASASLSPRTFGPNKEGNKEALAAILWIVKICDDQLAARRDNAIHTPFMLTLDENGEASLRANDQWGSTRANGLSRRPDLTIYFTDTKTDIHAIHEFTTGVHNHLLWPEHFPLPAKPSLRALGQQNPHTKARRKALPKE